MPLEELRSYLPARDEQPDFDDFWQSSIEAARERADAPVLTPHETRLTTIDSYDVTFSGFDGQPVRGWLNVPRDRTGPLPCVVEFIGYGGGRGNAEDWLLYSAAGYAHLVMDTRGQGGTWRNGATLDRPTSNSTHHPGFMTLGIDSPANHYYRRLYVDAVRAVETAAGCDLVDGDRVAVVGTSQGGGVAIAAAGLSPHVKALAAGVPFLCHIRRAITIVDTNPYFEVTRFLRADPAAAPRAIEVLSYIDGVNMAARATAPAMFSVALMDQVCPPSTVFAAYNHYQGPKDIRVWEYNDHDGASSHQALHNLEFLAQHL